LNCDFKAENGSKELYSFLIQVKKWNDKNPSLVTGEIKQTRLFEDPTQSNTLQREAKSLEVIWFDSASKTIFFKPAGYLTLNSETNEYILASESNGKLVDKTLSNCMVPEPGVVITN
jgi:hypothetical protein